VVQQQTNQIAVVSNAFSILKSKIVEEHLVIWKSEDLYGKADYKKLKYIYLAYFYPLVLHILKKDYDESLTTCFACNGIDIEPILEVYNLKKTKSGLGALSISRTLKIGFPIEDIGQDCNCPTIGKVTKRTFSFNFEPIDKKLI